MYAPPRAAVCLYYGFSLVQATKVFVEGTFISHTLSLCFVLSFMASRAKISSDPAVLLEYVEGLSCDSESDDDFDGYLRPEDGPVVCATVPEVVKREGLCSPAWRSLSTDDLTAAEVSELPESPFTSSVSPMQGQHSSGSPLSLTSETNSSHSTIFNSATKPTPQVCKNTLRHTCFEHNHAKVPLSSREQRKLVTWYKRFQGCIVKGLLTKKTSFPPRKRRRSKMTNGHPCG